MSNKQLAKELNRNIQSISNKLISLGLYRFDFNKNYQYPLQMKEPLK